ncbi:MAG: flagellar brake protein [Gammaproteobacteria bacterium]|nr:flagellar brake protein [Gammaproteobacteria bacterium]MDH5777347.1 flagellar brake protein [Gammaproteobacteria bacterium]
MSDDIFKVKPSKTASIEEHESFTIYSQTEIMQKMRMLSKGNCLITAFFDHGNESFMTAIIDVLPEKKLILVDCGPDEGMNKKLMSEGRVLFKSELAGISAQFSAHNLKRAKYKDQAVFAFEVPDELLWIQRRDTYRVKIPFSATALCDLTHLDNKKGQFRILDISAGGLALEDMDMHEDFQIGNIFKGCNITLPEHGNGMVTLEVRNLLPLKHNDPGAGQRVGCTFQNLPTDLDAAIQRYILHIDSLRKRLAD